MPRLERKDVMLAYPMTERKLSSFHPHCIGQPKLNGERCRVEWFEDVPILFSSYGNEFMFLDNIRESLLDMPKLPYDGELYVHGWTRDKIASVANRKKNRHPEVDKLELHVFDYQARLEHQITRINHLKSIKPVGQVKIVDSFVLSPHIVLTYTQELLNLGYEGIILRSVQGGYETRRSNSMLKYKPTKVDYYQIIAVLEALSEDGEPKEMVGAFQVIGDEREAFKVGAGKLTHDERGSLWERRSELIGKWLKVKHEEIQTSGGVPVSCVALSVVNEKGDDDTQ